jgi:hypothetical protein
MREEAPSRCRFESGGEQSGASPRQREAIGAGHTTVPPVGVSLGTSDTEGASADSAPAPELSSFDSVPRGLDGGAAVGG